MYFIFSRPVPVISPFSEEFPLFLFLFFLFFQLGMVVRNNVWEGSVPSAWGQSSQDPEMRETWFLKKSILHLSTYADLYLFLMYLQNIEISHFQTSLMGTHMASNFIFIAPFFDTESLSSNVFNVAPSLGNHLELRQYIFLLLNTHGPTTMLPNPTRGPRDCSDSRFHPTPPTRALFSTTNL